MNDKELKRLLAYYEEKDANEEGKDHKNNNKQGDNVSSNKSLYSNQMFRVSNLLIIKLIKLYIYIYIYNK